MWRACNAYCETARTDSPTYEQVKQDVDAIQAGMDTPHPDKGAEYVKPVH